MMKAAEVLVRMLLDAGVSRVYGVSGDSLNAFTDAIRTNKGLEWVHVRHEEAGAFAAGAEAHLTDQLAVCAGSCGPALPGVSRDADRLFVGRQHHAQAHGRTG